MISVGDKQPNLRYLTPDNLYDSLKQFTKGMAVTQGSFELLVERCTFADMEWNHMDQLHRPAIHKTYQKGIRIALGKDFAVSLTQWSRWPLFITVSDVRVTDGLYYQCLSIAGLIYLHSIISMKQEPTGIFLKNEWYIASSKIFKFMHPLLDRKLYKLNKRLQEEDAQIRHGRYEVREKGYRFRGEPYDYCTANSKMTNTIYPQLTADGFFLVDDVNETPMIKSIGNVEFIVKKVDDRYCVWPAQCPHEGGPLIKGEFCKSQIVCPWHHLRFSPVELSVEVPQGQRYGLAYQLAEEKIYVKTINE